jgi:hypothetical protein
MSSMRQLFQNTQRRKENSTMLNLLFGGTRFWNSLASIPLQRSTVFPPDAGISGRGRQGEAVHGYDVQKPRKEASRQSVAH